MKIGNRVRLKKIDNMSQLYKMNYGVIDSNDIGIITNILRERRCNYINRKGMTISYPLLEVTYGTDKLYSYYPNFEIE